MRFFNHRIENIVEKNLLFIRLCFHLDFQNEIGWIHVIASGHMYIYKAYTTVFSRRVILTSFNWDCHRFDIIPIHFFQSAFYFQANFVIFFILFHVWTKTWFFSFIFDTKWQLYRSGIVFTIMCACVYFCGDHFLDVTQLMNVTLYGSLTIQFRWNVLRFCWKYN